MPEAVLSPNEVSINAVRYKTAGPVQRSLVSVYPGKIVTGDYTKDSHPTLSTLSLSDHRGGIGLDIMTGDGDTDRSWYSTADTRYKGHLILSPLVTNQGTLPAGHSQTRHLMFFNGSAYVDSDATTNGIYAINSSVNLIAFNSTVQSDWGVVEIAGVKYLLVGGSDRYVYYDGSTWTERVVGASGGWMVGWLNRVWGKASSGLKLWYTFTPGSAEVFLGATPNALTASSASFQLFVAKDASGEDTLYMATTIGLFAYDLDNDRWIATGLQVPDTSTFWTTRYASGVRWRDKIYYGIRSTIYEYSFEGGQAIIRDIGFGTGLSPNNGLPTTKGYIVNAMVASHNEVIASLVGNTSDSKTSIIVAWNGRGWRVLYEGGSGLDEQLFPLLVADISGNMNLVFANNTTSPYNISQLRLSADVYAPVPELSYAYATAATHDWPWFTAGQDDVTKVAVRVKVQTTNPTTAETVKVYYAINRSSTFQLMTNSTYTTGVITATGLHTFDFPSVDSWVSTTARTGTAFRSIQFRVVYARGGTTTNTPDVLSLTLEYYKKLDAKWQFGVSLDLTNDYKGNTSKQLRAALLTAQETATLLEFTYRDPDTNSDATFYVQVRPATAEENTGLDERGTTSVLLVEV